MPIYYIRKGAEGPIKIGFTAASVAKRMAQLQTGHHERLFLLGTSPGELVDEQAIHRELKEYHIHGEWFDPKPELIEIIKDMIDNQHKWYFFRKINVYILEVQCKRLKEMVGELSEKLKEAEEGRRTDRESMGRELSALRKSNKELKAQLAR